MSSLAGSIKTYKRQPGVRKGDVKMRAILYIGHGTRSKKGAKEAVSFFQNVMKKIDVPVQEFCFLELTLPSIEEGFKRCVERGATEITVVPIFLLTAGHIKEDIPQALKSLQKKYPFVQIHVRNSFGVQDVILEGIAALVRNLVEDLSPNDSILIVGRGSSDPEIHRSFAVISKGIQTRLNTENVDVCYLAATEPRLEEGLENITEKAAGRVIVIPYLLFSGLLLSEVHQHVLKRQRNGQSILHTGPLSTHSAIEEVVLRSALGREHQHAAVHY